MSFSLLHKLVTYFVSGLGLFAMTFGGEISSVSIALMFVGYVASYFVDGDIVRRTGYSRAWTGAVLGVFVVQLARALIGSPILALLIEFAAFIQISRLFNRRTAVDYQQIAVLSFVHLIAATVLSTELGFAFVFVGFVITAPWMLAVSHLRREIEGNYPGVSSNEPTAVADVRRVLASKRVVGPGFLAATAALALPVFLITAILFFLFPRVGVGLITLRSQIGQPQAGFSDRVELGGFGTIRDDPTVVIRVSPPLPHTPDASGLAQMRLRGTSFDRYDGQRWLRTVSRRQRVWNQYDFDSSTFVLSRRARPDGADRVYRISLEPLDDTVLFLPEQTVALAIPSRIRRSGVEGRMIMRDAGFDIRYLDPNGLGLIYDAVVSPDPDETWLDVATDEDLERYRQFPEGHERVRELALRLTTGVTSDLEKVARIESHLRTSGTYRYTLEQPLVRDQPPLVAFLFDARAGHCEYFSTAAAMLLRAAGVPARNVTGFLGGTWNAYGNYYALKHGDAHSWTEAWVGGRWITVDATPSGWATMRGRSGWLGFFRDAYDALENAWTTGVVGYDLRTQVDFLLKLRDLVRSRRGQFDVGGAIRSGPDAPTGPRARPNDAFRRTGALIGASALLFAVGAFVVWAWRRGRRRAQTALDADAAAAVELYALLERTLTKRGFERPASRTPLEHVEFLEQQGYPGAAVARAVTERYALARYARQRMSREEVLGLRARVASLPRSPTTPAEADPARN